MIWKFHYNVVKSRNFKIHMIIFSVEKSFFKIFDNHSFLPPLLPKERNYL